MLTCKYMSFRITYAFYVKWLRESRKLIAAEKSKPEKNIQC